MRDCCDLLRINYLCGRITNHGLWRVVNASVVICSELTTFAVESPTLTLRLTNVCQVVICSELTTFAVESPTPLQTDDMSVGCDLLRINYLCGRITNLRQRKDLQPEVVICSELTTFAVESPTSFLSAQSAGSCDLLRINYLCGRITNTIEPKFIRYLVVICSELTTFAVESPTTTKQGQREFKLWFAQN